MFLVPALRHGIEVPMRKSWFFFQSWAKFGPLVGLLCIVSQAVHGLAVTTEGFKSHHGWLTYESVWVMQSLWASKMSPK